jgi:phosphatidylserine decarboxylase
MSVCARQFAHARAPVGTKYPRPAFRPAYTRLSPPLRTFSTSRPRLEQNFHRKESFRSRLNSALKNTKIKWEPIPIALGVAFLGAFQLYRIQRREKHTEAERRQGEETDSHGRPKKRERIRPSGPWQVQVMSTLPLKALSRVWGRFNELNIPYYLRVPGFKLYGFIFGVKLVL